MESGATVSGPRASGTAGDRAPLMVAVAQPPCVSHEVEVNARAHAAAVLAAQARVVVFPEMSLTGYELDAATVAPGDPRLSPIVEACAALGCLALVGAPTEGTGGRTHISMLAIDGAGVAVAYSKLWLGGLEPERFAPGAGPAVLEVGGWRMGLAICKDTGVPEHSAVTAALGIDAYLAGVCELAEDNDTKDLRARRISADHGIWVAVASFAGPTGGGFSSTAGRSGIWSPGGTLVTQVGAEVALVARTELSDASRPA